MDGSYGWRRKSCDGVDRKCGYRICDLDFVVEKTKGFVKVSGGSRRSDAGCILHQCSGSRKLDQAGKIR